MTEVCSGTRKPNSGDSYRPGQRGILHGNLVLLILHWLRQISCPPSACFWVFSYTVMKPDILSYRCGKRSFHGLHSTATEHQSLSSLSTTILHARVSSILASLLWLSFWTVLTQHFTQATCTGFTLSHMAERQCSGSADMRAQQSPGNQGRTRGDNTYPATCMASGWALSTTCGLYIVQETIAVEKALLYIWRAIGHLHGPLLQHNGEEELVQSRTRNPTELSGWGQDTSAGCAGLCVPGHNKEDVWGSLHLCSRACTGCTWTCCCCGDTWRASPFLTPTSDFAAHIKLPTLPKANNSPVLVFSIYNQTSQKT